MSADRHTVSREETKDKRHDVIGVRVRSSPGQFWLTYKGIGTPRQTTLKTKDLSLQVRKHEGLTVKRRSCENVDVVVQSSLVEARLIRLWVLHPIFSGAKKKGKNSQVN